MDLHWTHIAGLHYILIALHLVRYILSVSQVTSLCAIREFTKCKLIAGSIHRTDHDVMTSMLWRHLWDSCRWWSLIGDSAWLLLQLNTVVGPRGPTYDSMCLTVVILCVMADRNVAEMVRPKSIASSIERAYFRFAAACIFEKIDANKYTINAANKYTSDHGSIGRLPFRGEYWFENKTSYHTWLP